MPRITILGSTGHQGTRYAASARAMGWEVSGEIGQHDDFVVCCWPPHRHMEAFELAMAHGRPLLVEKPTACAKHQAEAMYDRARRLGVPFSTAFVHLHNPLLYRLRGAKDVRVTWKGPRVVYSERAHGREPLVSPASIEWGSHGWSIAHYLEASIDAVDTGYGPERATLVTTSKGNYSGEFEPGDQEPIRNVLLDFQAWALGEHDDRFDPELGIYVDRMCHQ